MTKELYILAAGGTGGHLFPAIAVAKELLNHKSNVAIFCDARSQLYLKNYNDLPSNLKIITLPIVRPSSGKLSFLASLVKSIYISMSWFLKHRPKAVIGFGGYVSVPTIIAAILSFIPTILHQQDAVLSRTNRYLAIFCNKLSLSFENTKFVNKFLRKKTFIAGAIYRPEFLMNNKRLAKHDDKFKIVVIGGSQGANALSTAVPKTIEILDKELQKRIKIVHQVRDEDMQNVKECYNETHVNELVTTPFIKDLHNVMQDADLIISRSGAGAIVEISAMGKPSVLIPYRYAMDNHQYYNAKILSDKGAAILIQEVEFSTISFAKTLSSLMTNDELRTLMGLRASKAFKKNSLQSLTKHILAI